MKCKTIDIYLHVNALPPIIYDSEMLTKTSQKKYYIITLDQAKGEREEIERIKGKEEKIKEEKDGERED